MVGIQVKKPVVQFVLILLTERTGPGLATSMRQAMKTEGALRFLTVLVDGADFGQKSKIPKLPRRVLISA